MLAVADGRTTVGQTRSLPYLVASDIAVFAATEDALRIPVPTTSFAPIATGGAAVNPLVSFTYRPVGIILEVVPQINPEGLVIMDVAPEISQLTNATIAAKVRTSSVSWLRLDSTRSNTCSMYSGGASRSWRRRTWSSSGTRRTTGW